MKGEIGTGGAGYRAFISYSHRDAVFAGRLHRRLEAYRLPPRLGAGRRLSPIFKDREELPAAHDLSVQVRAALAVSDSLVILCSPDAAASPWVGREIETFRALHPDRPILAALLRGEPAEAFPPALSAGGVEPLAADFRKTGDGERLALLKLVAGIAGLGVDQLVQRDAQRRLRGVMAVTAMSLAAMVAMGGMTVFALNARAEADRQRAEAEKLVDFMLTDLRVQLKGVGRLPLMTTVTKQALAYYSGQDLDSLPDESLERRARLLHALGEDDAARNDLAGGEAIFGQAWRVSEALLAEAPDNPERLFTHAQSAYWRGYIHYLRRQTPEARAGLEDYRSLTRRLLKVEPGAVRSLREAAYADGNLCSLALQQEQAPDRALKDCRSAIEGMSAAFALRPHDAGLALDLATRWAGLADVQVELKDYAGARESRSRQAGILGALLKADPENAELRDNWGICHRGMAFIAYRQGDLRATRANLRIAQATFHDLSAMDPQNKRWREQSAYADRAIPIIEAELMQEPAK